MWLPCHDNESYEGGVTTTDPADGEPVCDSPIRLALQSRALSSVG